MKFYIASKYIDNHDINTEIYHALKDKGYEVFLPKSINIDGTTEEEMCQIAKICYSEIDNTDILLVVFPFGLSIAAEVGYAISIKRKRDMRIILFNNNSDEENKKKLLKEAMLTPYWDKIGYSKDLYVSSIEELMKFLEELEKRKVICDV
jgi:nucleoside 2-deoxyribosyltransferase